MTWQYIQKITTATRRPMFDNHCPRRHGAGKYHFVISFHEYIWGYTLNREAICSARRADAGNRLSNALCRRGYLNFSVLKG